jgi:proteasome lid subunit RPN8/RPN11
MSLEITTTQLKIIYDRAESIYPEECCGILLGKFSGESKIIIEVIPTINDWEASGVKTDRDLDRTKHSRYSIPPAEIFQAQKRGRDRQLEIVGFFHSHPDAPAIPSTCDRDRAWEIYSYPIVSLIQGKVESIASWVLDRDGIFQPEEIKTNR